MGQLKGDEIQRISVSNILVSGGMPRVEIPKVCPLPDAKRSRDIRNQTRIQQGLAELTKKV